MLGAVLRAGLEVRLSIWGNGGGVFDGGGEASTSSEALGEELKRESNAAEADGSLLDSKRVEGGEREGRVGWRCGPERGPNCAWLFPKQDEGQEKVEGGQHRI